MHRDIVYEWPDDAERLGSTEVCKVQAMYAKGRYIAVQGHPEFNADVMSELLNKRHEMGIFNDAMYKEAIGRATIHHDVSPMPRLKCGTADGQHTNAQQGIAVAAAFLRFLLER